MLTDCQIIQIGFASNTIAVCTIQSDSTVVSKIILCSCVSEVMNTSKLTTEIKYKIFVPWVNKFSRLYIRDVTVKMCNNWS